MTDELKPCPFDREELIDLIQIGIDNTMDIDTSSYDWAQGAADLILKEWNTRTPTPAAPQTGYSWTNSAPQDAPETIYLDPYNSKDWTEGGEFLTELIVKQHPNHRVPYTPKATSDARIAKAEAIAQAMRGSAYAAVNPANWQVNDSPENRRAHYEKTLNEIADQAQYINVFEETFATMYARIAALQAERDEDANQLDSARYTVDVLTARIATARNEALEEAAEWHEGRAVLCEKEVGKDAKGKQIYSEAAVRHRWFAGSIRALKTQEGK